MKEQNEEKQAVEVSDFLAKTEAFIEKNKNTIYIVIGAIVVVVLGYFGLKKWYFEPRAEEAASEMFMAENYFDNYEYDKALNGNPETNALGFLDIINDYSGTKSANLARYYAGLCELRLGLYDDAISHLKKYNGKDTYTKSLALMARGDAEMELGNDSEALALYEKAAKSGDNEIVAPTALFKAGLVQMKLGNNDKAVASFQKIKEKYPFSNESSEVDKYIAFAGDLK